MIISNETIKTFERASGLYLGFCKNMHTFSLDYNDYINTYKTLSNAEVLLIYGFVNDKPFSKRIKAPKKEITINYLLQRLEKLLSTESSYCNLSSVFNKLIPNSFFYPTSYGFGMDCFRINPKNSEMVKTVCSFLDKHKIVYYNEYSDAMWVYRFVISKSKENIEKIQKLS